MSKTEWTFTVPVNPVAKARPRMGRHGNVYTPRDTVVYEQHVAAAVQASRLPRLTKPLAVRLHFYVESKRGGPSDLDNYIKSTLDGLKDFFNDRIVRRIEAERVYPYENGYALVHIEEIP